MIVSIQVNQPKALSPYGLEPLYLALAKVKIIRRMKRLHIVVVDSIFPSAMEFQKAISFVVSSILD